MSAIVVGWPCPRPESITALIVPAKQGSGRRRGDNPVLPFFEAKQCSAELRPEHSIVARSQCSHRREHFRVAGRPRNPSCGRLRSIAVRSQSYEGCGRNLSIVVERRSCDVLFQEQAVDTGRQRYDGCLRGQSFDSGRQARFSAIAGRRSCDGCVREHWVVSRSQRYGSVFPGGWESHSGQGKQHLMVVATQSHEEHGSQHKFPYRRNSQRLVAVVSEGKNETLQQLPMSVEYISSSNNPYVKHLVKLRQSAKTRSASASVLVVGITPLKEIICYEGSEICDRRIIDVLLVREDANTPEDLVKASLRIVPVSSAVMSKVSGHDSPPEAVGVLKLPPTFISLEDCQGESSAEMRRWCPSPRRVLVLDAVQDPGNMGALLRTAAAFAWDGVYLLPGCCDPFNDKALRAGRGATFRVPIATGLWSQMKDFASANRMKLFAGDPEPDKASSEILRSSLSALSRGKMEGEESRVEEDGLCLVLGSEGQGLCEEVGRDCVRVGIPMPGKFESLNVAVAGGILMLLLK